MVNVGWNSLEIFCHLLHFTTFFTVPTLFKEFLYPYYGILKIFFVVHPLMCSDTFVVLFDQYTELVIVSEPDSV